MRALLDEVDPARRAVRRFAVHSATLDDVFLALTGHATDRPTERSPPCLSHPPRRRAAARCPTLAALAGADHVRRCLRLARRNLDALLTSLLLPSC